MLSMMLFFIIVVDVNLDIVLSCIRLRAECPKVASKKSNQKLSGSKIAKLESILRLGDENVAHGTARVATKSRTDDQVAAERP